jgi:hypothetical protein
MPISTSRRRPWRVSKQGSADGDHAGAALHTASHSATCQGHADADHRLNGDVFGRCRDPEGWRPLAWTLDNRSMVHMSTRKSKMTPSLGCVTKSSPARPILGTTRPRTAISSGTASSSRPRHRAVVARPTGRGHMAPSTPARGRAGQPKVRTVARRERRRRADRDGAHRTRRNAARPACRSLNGEAALGDVSVGR